MSTPWAFAEVGTAPFAGESDAESPFAGFGTAGESPVYPAYLEADQGYAFAPERDLGAEVAGLATAHESPGQWGAGGALWVPGAERVDNPRSAGGSYVDGPWRFVFHTIEGEPTEQGFRALAAHHPNPPHLWAMPAANLLLQTIQLDRSAYALARPGTTDTNRRRALQVEVWGFATNMGKATPEVLNWLADRVLAPVARLLPINLDRVLPTGGDRCYGANSGCRMTAAEWQAFDGICGHQHVPDNAHWDPGHLNLQAIVARARASVRGTTAIRHEIPVGDHDGPGFVAERDDGESPRPDGQHQLAWMGPPGNGETGAGSQTWADVEQQAPPPAPAPTPAAAPTPAPAAAPFVPPAPPSPPLPGPVPVSRPCCMLAGLMLTGVNALGRHDAKYPFIVYTGKAGFVDLGHLWAAADVTAYAYQVIHGAGGASGTTIRTSEGTATLTSPAPAAEWLDLARSIAYDDALTHEIDTYAKKRAGFDVPGYHNSSFSPEDLPSNYLGTVVAARALTAGGPFVAQAETQLGQLMASLDAQSTSETKKAFALISHQWVESSLPLGFNDPTFLRRRNFTRTPWKAGHSSDAPTPAFVVQPFVLTSTYSFRHATGFTSADFATRIAAIRADAALPSRYGPNYDQP